MVEFKYADETEVRASQLMTPDMGNHLGSVHGGEVLKLADNYAYVCAARFAGKVCVTAAFDRVDFHEPVKVGELLTIISRINYAGRTSMEVEIEIFAEDIPTGAIRRTNSCHVTMVALENGRPSMVPKLICRTREDKARNIQARMRRQMGLQYRKDRDEFLARYEAMDDNQLDALIAETN